jgi:hypothetical protein
LSPDACGGTITRTYSVTDDCDNQILVTQTITVDDTTIPEIAVGPADITIECAADLPAEADLAWTDNCDAGGTVTSVTGPLVGGACGGTYTRTWNISDACGNAAATVTQTITLDDTTDPTGTAPADVTVECSADVPAFDTALITDEADNCAAAPVVTHISDVSDGNTCPEVITRTYRITDDCGNSTDVTQTITVDDTIAPTGTAPADVTVECVADIPVVDVLSITDEDDNCAVVPVVTHVSDTALAPDACGGTITRTYRITDDCGNSTDVTQTITVDDTTNPTASNPAPVSVQCIGDIPAVDITVVTDEADNCTVNPIVAWVSDTALSPDACGGTITRTYSV